MSIDTEPLAGETCDVCGCDVAYFVERPENYVDDVLCAEHANVVVRWTRLPGAGQLEHHEATMSLARYLDAASRGLPRGATSSWLP